MKARFQLEGDEVEAETRELSTLGTFVITDKPRSEGPLELALGSQTPVHVKGEVVCVTADGFGVAFGALAPEQLDDLLRLLDPAAAAPPPGEPENPAAELSFEIQGEDWSPPVSEPVLHEWRPEKDFVQPPPGDGAHPGWASLPTLAGAGARVPAATEPVPTPAQPEPAPATPEDKAREFLSGGARQAAGPQAVPQAVAASKTEAAGEDQRLSKRHDRSIPVSFENLTGLIKEFTHNISYGGMFVFTSQPLPENAETAVTLVHPVHGERLSLLAKVVHASHAPTPDPKTGEKRYGLGIEFRMPLDELKRLLADFIGSHQKSGASPEAAQIISDARAILRRGEESSYALLGIREGAPTGAVRQAYFKLVDRFHPDRYFDKVNSADRKVLEELFRKLTKAYEQLTA